MTLPLAERLALQRHPAVTTARADVAVAETRRREAEHARFLPQAELRNVWGPIPRARGEFTDTGVLVSPDTSTSLSDLRWFTQVDLELVQPLYTFGRIDALVDAARAGGEASRSGLAAAELDVRLQVRELYWGVVLGQELLAVADGVLDRLAEADSILAERIRQGDATQNDRFKLDIFEYEAHKRHREAQDRLALARAGLRAALGVDPQVAIRVATDELTALPIGVGSLDRYVEIALDRRPELSGLRAGIEARQSLARSRRAELWPQLFAGAQVTWNRAPSRFDPKNPFVHNPTNFFRPGVVVGFRWNANLFRTRDRIRLAEHEASKLRGQLDPLTRKIRLEVREAYLDVVRAERDVEGSARALTASENWFRAESQTFDLGLGDIEDLVEAFRANVEMQVEHLRNVFAFNVALAKLSRAVGRDVYEGS